MEIPAVPLLAEKHRGYNDCFCLAQQDKKVYYVDEWDNLVPANKKGDKKDYYLYYHQTFEVVADMAAYYKHAHGDCLTLSPSFYLENAKYNDLFVFVIDFSVFDKGIITRHLKNGANLHQTAAIGENSKRRFLRDMAGVYRGPPCFGYQGGPQQTPAIPPEKSNYRHSNFETKCPKAIVVPAHFYIGALVVYPPSPPTIKHRREQAVKGA